MSVVMYRARGKRLMDLVLTMAALLLIWPLLLVTAALVRFMLGSPILFRQERPGLRGQPFLLLKFRTMTEGRETGGGALLSDAERLTKFGKFLRSTSLDELPELLNVLLGEMSLVGPRPLLMRYLTRYTPEQMRRHEVRPGITGLAQVSGRNTLSWEEKFRLDLRYVEELSFALDLKILARTLWNVMTRTGISQEGHATMREFGATETGKRSEDELK